MVPVHIFINGCSFLTIRRKDDILTHTGLELSKLMELDVAGCLAAGGRGNRRISFTTKVWCEKNPELGKECFFLIGITVGTRFDYPTKDGYKKHKFPSLNTTWKTFSPHQNQPSCRLNRRPGARSRDEYCWRFCKRPSCGRSNPPELLSLNEPYPRAPLLPISREHSPACSCAPQG